VATRGWRGWLGDKAGRKRIRMDGWFGMELFKFDLIMSVMVEI
jgi:hypothetical protein